MQTRREAKTRRLSRLLLMATWVSSSVLPAAFAGDQAVLVLVDRSESMVSDDKWTISSDGIVQALDQDAFDALDVGLISAPSGSVTGPACVFGLPVSCQAPSFPQNPIGPAGPKSGDGPGKRREIRDWLLANPPDTAGAFGDRLPLYDTLVTGIAALQAWSGNGRRVLIVITDGGMGCTQLSSPARPGYADCNCDHEWELPDTLIFLLASAQADGSTPVDTFVVGVPGADTNGGACPTDLPPYSMRLALSAMAAAGSDHEPADCTGDTFIFPGGVDPTIPCHYDLTTGTFDADALASVIAEVVGFSGLEVIFSDGFESGDTTRWSSTAQ